MHPLDSVSLDGFDMVASTETVLRHSFEDVWRLLALEADEPLALPDGARHRVVERFGPGEHRCSTLRSVRGREVCARGFRRLAHHEVLEFQGRPAEDHLIRITYLPLMFGRTRMTSHAGVRSAARVPPMHAEDVSDRWQRVLDHRHEDAQRYLQERH